MATMMRGVGVLLILGVAALGMPARAQFYDLDGAYRCLKAPDAACEKVAPWSKDVATTGNA